MNADNLNGLLLDAQRASERNDWARVIQATDEMLKRSPADADALFLAGVAFLKCNNEGVALQMFNTARQATTKEVALSAIWNNIGCCFLDYDPMESYKAFKESLNHGQPQRSVYDNLCNVASQIGRHAEALEWADKSIEIGGADPSYNKSFALFHLGRWAEAWPEYAKSVGTREGTDRGYGLPRYEAGVDWSKVLIHGEQGIGDEILFMSMLPGDFAGVIECHPRNATLFARSFPKARVYGTLGQPYLDWFAGCGCTHEIEMGGLGEFFAPTPLAYGPFLAPDKARRAASVAWLGQRSPRMTTYQHGPGEYATGSPIRVGLAWTGGSWRTGRARRSVPFYEMLKLRAVPGVTFVCLEYEDRREELKQANLDWLNPTWATKKGADMDDLAALVSSLDLVISATTSVVDLCGALGVECWAMVDEHPQWRYSDAAGEHAMWFYESVRTFRQKAADQGAWSRVMGEIRGSLIERTQQQPDNVSPVSASEEASEAERNDPRWRSC